ncbi:hypothetical protein CENSYa_0620 [Cenarchaeum symbiosum A]|uniref:Nascent polypeptide-associated complex protein n=1 Tax=Cenarchaeum symbiosum (strain A) TaxID=414004 RepID=A0RV86_CENSY|nr:hypothetical protein CENSYa_0620 [Cenarchaeum symbiosum A]
MTLSQKELDEINEAFPDDGVDPHMEAMLTVFKKNLATVPDGFMTIRINGKDIVFVKPHVTEMKKNDSYPFMISEGRDEEKYPGKPTHSDDMINVVCNHTGVGRKRAMEALDDAKGDTQQAIILLRND